MPLGIVRTDLNKTETSFKNGTPITLPHTFGNHVVLPKNFGNPVPPTDPTFNSNPVTWTPNPAHFGNGFNSGPSVSGFQLEDNSGILLLEDGTILLLEVQ